MNQNRDIVKIIIVELLMFAFTGCATVFKGYEDSVRLINAPDSLRVTTNEGAEIRVATRKIVLKKDSNKQEDSYMIYTDPTIKIIKLRSNKEHTLILKYQDKEKIVTVYPKIVFGWALLDFICGIIPSFYDAYTGNWNEFSDIDASFETYMK